jgi:hypothetical protein
MPAPSLPSTLITPTGVEQGNSWSNEKTSQVVDLQKGKEIDREIIGDYFLFSERYSNLYRRQHFRSL